MERAREYTKEIRLQALAAAVLTASGGAVLLAPYLYGKLPHYSEFIAGLTIWDGYFKKGDMWIAQGFLIGVPILFLLFFKLLKRLEQKKELLPQASGIITALKTMYALVLSAVFLQSPILFEISVVFLIAVVIFLTLFRRRAEQELQKETIYWKLVCYSIFSSFFVYSLCLGAGSFIQGQGRREFLSKAGFIGAYLSILLPVVFVFFFRNLFYTYARKVSAFLQTILPIGIIGFYQFLYAAENDLYVQLFYSKRLCFCLYGVTVLFILYQVWYFYLNKKRKYSISIVTIITIAVLRVFSQPSGIVDIDFFHNGEITLPFHQLISYGKIPYVDCVPIHGFCDYYYGAINYIFFGGAYLSIHAAQIIGNVIFAGFLSCVILFAFDNRKAAFLTVYLFMPFFVEKAGMRYIMLFTIFFILCSKKARKESLTFLWWWVLLSIFAIGWNVSIGGAAAVAFLPIVFYLIMRQIPLECKRLFAPKSEADRKKRRKVFIMYGFLLVIGIAFIPLFLQMVQYLRENAATTLWSNGMEMINDTAEAASYFVPGFVNGQSMFYLQAFGFLLPISLCLYYGSKGYKRAWALLAVLFSCFFVLFQYAFVRYDEGLRAGVIGIFFSLLALLILSKRMKTSPKDRTVCLFLFGFLIITSNTKLLPGKEEFFPVNEMPAAIENTIHGESVEDPVVFVDGASEGIENLGTGFIQGNTWQNLQNIHYVFTHTLNGETRYLDLTNGIAQAVIFHKEICLTYTSVYNISNEITSQSAIRQLKENPPKLILAAPFIKFDEAPMSIRSMHLYEEILAMGYRPYCYENIIYLMKDSNTVPGSTDGTAAFAELGHKEYLGMLPAIWADADSTKKLEKTQIPCTLIETPEGMQVIFQTPISGEMADFLELTILDENSTAEPEKSKNNSELITLKFQTLVGGILQEKEFRFMQYGNRFLIPAGSSPYWKWEQNITGFSLEGIYNKKIETFRAIRTSNS